MKKHAIISVSNKKNLAIICKSLKKYNIEIIATGNTYKKICKLGFKVKTIDEFTNFNEILNGRVKTLHPKLFGGILFKRNSREHLNTIVKKNIPIIDFVIVNLYPFKKSEKNLNKCIDNIDIGGHSLIRSAAKNFNDVTVICSPKDYFLFCNELKKHNGKTSLSFRKTFAAKSFAMIVEYDSKISNWLNNNTSLKEKYKKIELIYGENPHQKAFYYPDTSKKKNIILNKISGKKISYNNINDSNAALECLSEFSKPTAVIVKHGNPCGVSSCNKIHSALSKSLKSDPQSSFGGIVALNRVIDETTSKQISKNFFEVILAPNFSKKAINILTKKKNLILIKSPKINNRKSYNEIKNTRIGFLEQKSNNLLIKKHKLKCVTKIKASKKVLNDMYFAYAVCKHVKSNAIVIAKNGQTLGIGAGQMSRLDAINIALKKMDKNFKKNYYVIASDAFFPFADNISVLKGKKCAAIIQPGGSINDHKIIFKANSFNIPMYFTGIRHFKH